MIKKIRQLLSLPTTASKNARWSGRDELQSVYGIGKNVADRIKWAVSEEIKIYGKAKNR